MAKDLGCGVKELLTDSSRRSRIDLKKYVTDEVGLPTLTDILQELAKPGRDPRQQFEAFSFAEGVEKVEDLKPGMKLPGIVTNVTAFGAFVDVGVHQDGLVHISQVADQFVKNPAEVLKVGQRVQATVMEVDLQRKRISLSLRSNPDLAGRGDGGRTRPGGAGGVSGGDRRDTRSGGGRDGRSGGGGSAGGGGGGFDWFTAAMNKK
jgi:uncharacterized protein